MLFGRIGCLYAFELGKLRNRLNSPMQMPLGFVIASLSAQSQGAGCPRHHGLPRGTSGQGESTLKCQEAGDCLPDSKTFTSRKVWRHTLPDLQPDTSAGWAALPLAVRMPTCSSPPCAPDVKRRQDLSSPSEKWGAVHVCGSISYFCQPMGCAGYLAPLEVWALVVPPWLLPSSQSSLALSAGPGLGGHTADVRSHPRMRLLIVPTSHLSLWVLPSES